MRRIVLPAIAALLVSGGFAAADEWVTIKGQVVFPEDKKIPERAKLNVTQDKDHCSSKGDLLDESVIVSPKTRGVKNVVVFLRPDDTDPKSEFPKDKIFPDDAKRKFARRRVPLRPFDGSARACAAAAGSPGRTAPRAARAASAARVGVPPRRRSRRRSGDRALDHA